MICVGCAIAFFVLALGVDQVGLVEDLQVAWRPVGAEKEDAKALGCAEPPSAGKRGDHLLLLLRPCSERLRLYAGDEVPELNVALKPLEPSAATITFECEPASAGTRNTERLLRCLTS